MHIYIIIDPMFPEMPFLPDVSFQFPVRTFGVGEKAREKRCSLSALVKYPRAHYDVARDLVFCHTCVSALRKSKKIYTIMCKIIVTLLAI